MTSSPPPHWDNRRLKSLARIVNGGTPSSTVPEYWDGNISWLTPDDLGKLNTAYVKTGARSITQEGYNSCSTTLAPAGSIVVSTRAPIGHTAILEADACVNQGCRILVPDKTIQTRYLYRSLTALKHELETRGKGTTFAELSHGDLGTVPILVPPPSEQTSIVHYLDHADELISRYISAKERLIALLEEQRKTVIHQAVTRGLHPNVSLTPSGIPSLGDVPAHWDLRRAKFTYHESDQRSYSGVEELMSVSHITGVTPRKQNVTMFLAQSNEGYKLCRPGDIVVNTMWAYMAALGVARQSGLVSPSYGVYRPRVDGLVNPEYMDLLLRTENYRVEYTRRSKGITASRLRLYPDDFLDIPFLRPPTDEQTHIVKYLRRATANVDSTIDRTHRQIALMNEYRTRLIADVVTGQIDVRDTVVELPGQHL